MASADEWLHQLGFPLPAERCELAVWSASAVFTPDERARTKPRLRTRRSQGSAVVAAADRTRADDDHPERRLAVGATRGRGEPGEDKVWSEHLVERLAQLNKLVYHGWTPAQLAAAVKPGVSPIQVWGTDENLKGTNRPGYLREDVVAGRLSGPARQGPLGR